MSEIPQEIHLIYASTGGNTQHVMERVAEYWREQGVTTHLHRAEQTDISTIENSQYFVFATSTWDHGTINPFFDKLLAQMKESDFSGKIASFIGLGDRRYEKHYFCTGMLVLKKVWEDQNGTAVGVPMMIGREPFEDRIEEMVKKWAEDTLPEYLKPQAATTAKISAEEAEQQKGMAA